MTVGTPAADRTRNSPILLDCTIRDGSYAIDFKFTAGDTALVAGLLSDAGVRYIEIGHGLGLGAAEAGHGRSAVDDIEAIAAARERAGDALLGAFFIPGIGTVEHLRAAAAAGLNFVRLGQDADRIDRVIPFAEEARAVGLEVFVNFMKTYGVSVTEFASAIERLAQIEPAGAYVVDSAGGMMPEEVAEYVRAARAVADVPIGFHGHNNLSLAVGNTLAAYEAGATFVDTTLCGIGRSSGNVPTEVMAAVFDRVGIDCGLDALALMDLAAAYIEPLGRRLPPEGLTAVALGYGRFHSSFVGRALDAAAREHVNPRRLIVDLGRRDPMRLTDEALAESVSKLRSAPSPEAQEDLVRFADGRFVAHRIRNRAAAVGELIEALGVVAAKGRLAIVLDLVASTALDDDELVAEYVFDDDEVALGRVAFGSAIAVAEALGGAADAVDLALLDLASLAPADAAAAFAALGEPVGHALLGYRSPTLELEMLADSALAAAARGGIQTAQLLDPGVYAHTDVAVLERALAAAVSVERRGRDPIPDVDICVVAGPLPESWPTDGPDVMALGARTSTRPGRTVLARDDALRGHRERWRRALAAGVRASRVVV